MTSKAERLAAERRLFEHRAALPAPPPPSFAEVLARARAGESPKKPRRLAVWSIVAAAAALVLVVGVAERESNAPRSDAAASIVAEPAPSGGACQDPRAIAAGAASHEERAYGACLSGTPNCAAAIDPHRADGGEEEEGSCVTCESCGPHPGEDLETRCPGESAP